MKTSIKKQTLLLLATVVVALLAAACSSDEDLETTITDGAERGVVKTEFTIAIPAQPRSMTRMSGTTVQEGAANDETKFRGINNIVLIPFAKTTAVAAADVPATIPITLNTLLKPTSTTVSNYIPNGNLLNTSNSVLYKDVAIPVGTGAFLFYGKAIDNTATETGLTTTTDRFKYGIITSSITDNSAPSSYSFSLVPISTDNIDDSDNDAASGLTTYLNSIVGVAGWSSDTNLGSLYNEFVKLKAGSSKSIESALTALMTSLKPLSYTLATTIRNTVKNSTYVDVAADDVTVTLKSPYNNYPGSMGLPDGAAVLSFSAGSFSYVQDAHTIDNTIAKSLNIQALNKLTYPASLYYRVNSNIKVSNAEQNTNYTDDATWTAITNNYTNGSSITMSTKSCALLAPVQYAVARLDTHVKASGTTLADAEGTNIDINTGDKAIKLCGVLIGNQKNVNWQFTPADALGDLTIYDNMILGQDANENQTGVKVTTAATPEAACHTLVFESYANQKVNVALEFINNTGTSFVGKDGLIDPGCKFYLVAEMDPALDTGGLYNSSTFNQLFKQDYTTKATFTISSLRNALNCIPDLRTPQMELGLSVDLTWQTGITQEITIN